MALFVLKSDFEAVITTLALDGVTETTDAIWQNNVPIAVDMCANYMRHRYDTDVIFASINTWDLSGTVRDTIKGQVVAFDDTIEWFVGDYVRESGLLYVSIQDAPIGTLITNTAFWTQVAWLSGDRVEDSGVLYFAIQDVPPGTLITDTDFWTQGDSRVPVLVEKVLDIVLYNINTRLDFSEFATKLGVRFDGNDPQQRGGAVGYLKQVQKGDITIDAPLQADVISGDNVSGNMFISGSAESALIKNDLL